MLAIAAATAPFHSSRFNVPKETVKIPVNRIIPSPADAPGNEAEDAGAGLTEVSEHIQLLVRKEALNR